MTRYEKIAISLPAHAAENVRRAVRRGEAASVSAYITAAIEERAKQRSLRSLLEETLAETGGPLTAAEIRTADRLLGFAPRRRTKKSRR
jgi:Arc/MetJ-type ribon-helix-helix transcriptional regulator